MRYGKDDRIAKRCSPKGEGEMDKGIAKRDSMNNIMEAGRAKRRQRSASSVLTLPHNLPLTHREPPPFYNQGKPFGKVGQMYKRKGS